MSDNKRVTGLVEVSSGQVIVTSSGRSTPLSLRTSVARAMGEPDKNVCEEDATDNVLEQQMAQVILPQASSEADTAPGPSVENV